MTHIGDDICMVCAGARNPTSCAGLGLTRGELWDAIEAKLVDLANHEHSQCHCCDHACMAQACMVCVNTRRGVQNLIWHYRQKPG